MLPASVALVAVLCTALATQAATAQNIYGSLVGNATDSSDTIPNIPSAIYQVVEEAVTVAARAAILQTQPAMNTACGSTRSRRRASSSNASTVTVSSTLAQGGS
jgi:hypothetical protein